MSTLRKWGAGDVAVHVDSVAVQFDGRDVYADLFDSDLDSVSKLSAVGAGRADPGA